MNQKENSGLKWPFGSINRVFYISSPGCQGSMTGVLSQPDLCRTVTGSIEAGTATATTALADDATIIVVTTEVGIFTTDEVGIFTARITTDEVGIFTGHSGHNCACPPQLATLE